MGQGPLGSGIGNRISNAPPGVGAYGQAPPSSYKYSGPGAHGAGHHAPPAGSGGPSGLFQLPKYGGSGIQGGIGSLGSYAAGAGSRGG